MARGKAKKTGGHGKRYNRSQPSSSNTFVRSSQAQFPPSDHETSTFTLRDAAHNSERPPSFWSSSGLSLRHRTMNFVPSQGQVSEDQDQDRDQEDRELRDSPNLSFHRPNYPDFLKEGAADGMVLNESVDEDRNVTTPEIDSSKSESPRKLSSTSTSSDEVVFAGRNKPAQARSYAPSVATKSPKLPSEQPSPAYSAGRSSFPVPGKFMQRDFDAKQEDACKPHDPNRIQRQPTIPDGQATDEKKMGPYQMHRKRSDSGSSSDDNLRPSLDAHFANLRADENAENLRPSTESAKNSRAERDGWASSDIEDFESLSTSEEVLDAIQQVLSKRFRSGRLQYLIVWRNQTVDEARWIPSSSLTMPGAVEIIEAFESQKLPVATVRRMKNHSGDSDFQLKWCSDSDSELDMEDDDDDDEDEDEDEDDFEDEKDLIERRMARMTDEHIARLFQKQESLGITSEELQIFDGEEDFDLSADTIDSSSRAMSRKKRNQKRRKGQREAVFDTNSGMLLDGDSDYGDFDIMDHDRLSLDTLKQHPINPFLLGLSDSELAQNLRDTWASDRKKKRLKKQEREELRAQGLLGKGNKFKPDLKAKYNEGMSLEQIEEELEDFFFNEQQQSLSLPPMAKHERMVLHKIAAAFGLKSKSQGSNKTRFTILYKTPRTATFDSATYDKLRVQMRRRFFPRLDHKGRGHPPRSGQNHGRGAGDRGYRDGEVVGAAAPELGADNRGRAMLEKMGWSMGTALGALDNQGILTPVEQVVRNSRAGLG